MVRRSFVIVVSVIVLAGLAVLGPQAKADEHLFDLRVKADPATFNSVDTSGSGSFFEVRGDICKDPTLGAPCVSIGKFRCKGFMDPNHAFVDQEFLINKRGKIATQGIEATGGRPVVGGTGDMRYARGQVKKTDFSRFADLGEFVSTFQLIDVIGGPLP